MRGSKGNPPEDGQQGQGQQHDNTKPADKVKEAQEGGGGGGTKDEIPGTSSSNHQLQPESQPGPSERVKSTRTRKIQSRNHEDTRQVGMYRHYNGVKKYTALLPVINRAFKKYYPWPPTSTILHSSGYYFDWDAGDGDIELYIQHIPPTTKVVEVLGQVPLARKVTIYTDGTAVVPFMTTESASKAYNASSLTKLGYPYLDWVKPEDAQDQDHHQVLTDSPDTK